VRSTTVLTEIGPVEFDVLRDTDASFSPQLVRKRQRRLTGSMGRAVADGAGVDDRGDLGARRRGPRCLGIEGDGVQDSPTK
jgi:hypothetical protein